MAGVKEGAQLPNPSMLKMEGIKFDSGKTRMELLPPEMMESAGKVYTFGAVKYGDRNWEEGMDWGRKYGAAQRHLNAWWGGQDKDPETGFSHLDHALTCISMLVVYEQRGVGVDSRNG